MASRGFVIFSIYEKVIINTVNHDFCLPESTSTFLLSNNPLFRENV